MTNITDRNADTNSNSSVPALQDVAFRQQRAAAPDSDGRSAALCGLVRFASVVAAIASPQNRILRLPEVMARVGLKRASIYQHVAAGSFPKQISLGIRAVGWLESEIDEWLAARINARQPTKT